MGRRMAPKMANSSLNRVRPVAGVVHSAPADGDKETGSNGGDSAKVMIVIDSSMEARDAVQWALSHVVRNHDVVILLHVVQPSRLGRYEDVACGRRVSEFLACMKSMCQCQRPEVHVEMTIVEGKEKGPAIVKEANRVGATLLILGQKKPWTMKRVMSTWALASDSRMTEIEYCIQNANCMAIAVRRKSKKVGGYLITTKIHRDFWLLA